MRAGDYNQRAGGYNQRAGDYNQRAGGCGCGTDVAGLTPIQAPGPMSGGRRRGQKARKTYKARRTSKKYKTRKH